MHDSHGIQSSAGNDRSFHDICRGSPPHDSVSRKNVRSLVWIARHGCPITFQSDNGKVFACDLTKELMKRSQVAQAHSTTHHPETNGLVERQNRTLVSMLRGFCSRYIDDWDRHFPQVMGAYNSTEHSTTGVSPHMMLNGQEKALSLTFFYPEYEKGKQHRKRTCVILLEGSRTSMTYAGGTPNRRKSDKRGDLIKGLQIQKPTRLAIMSGCCRN